jgi:hypothetical protein
MVKIQQCVNAIGAHHDEMEMQYVISRQLSLACDAIQRSPARCEKRDHAAIHSAYQGSGKFSCNGILPALKKHMLSRQVGNCEIIVGRQIIVNRRRILDQLSFEIAQNIQKRNDLLSWSDKGYGNPGVRRVAVNVGQVSRFSQGKA